MGDVSREVSVSSRGLGKAALIASAATVLVEACGPATPDAHLDITAEAPTLSATSKEESGLPASLVAEIENGYLDYAIEVAQGQGDQQLVQELTEKREELKKILFVSGITTTVSTGGTLQEYFITFPSGGVLKTMWAEQNEGAWEFHLLDPDPDNIPQESHVDRFGLSVMDRQTQKPVFLPVMEIYFDDTNTLEKEMFYPPTLQLKGANAPVPQSVVSQGIEMPRGVLVALLGGIPVADVGPTSMAPTPETADLDGDGLPDAVDPDIDGDGALNNTESAVGTDPYDAQSVPPEEAESTIGESLSDPVEVVAIGEARVITKKFETPAGKVLELKGVAFGMTVMAKDGTTYPVTVEYLIEDEVFRTKVLGGDTNALGQAFALAKLQIAGLQKDMRGTDQPANGSEVVNVVIVLADVDHAGLTPENTIGRAQEVAIGGGEVKVAFFLGFPQRVGNEIFLTSQFYYDGETFWEFGSNPLMIASFIRDGIFGLSPSVYNRINMGSEVYLNTLWGEHSDDLWESDHEIPGRLRELMVQAFQVEISLPEG